MDKENCIQCAHRLCLHGRSANGAYRCRSAGCGCEIAGVSSRFRRVDRGWVRDEPGYLSGGDRAYTHVVDDRDESPHHHTYPTGYDSRCGWCWLGAPHSEAAHAAKIGE